VGNSGLNVRLAINVRGGCASRRLGQNDTCTPEGNHFLSGNSQSTEGILAIARNSDVQLLQYSCCAYAEKWLTKVANFRHSAKSHCCRQGGNSVLSTSPNEYRTRYIFSGSLELVRIPQAYNLMTAGAVGTNLNIGHRIHNNLDFLWGHMCSSHILFGAEFLNHRLFFCSY
jgi:hypothetical protein